MILSSRILRLFVALLASSVVVVVSAGIYPDDHWSFSTKLTTSNYRELIQGEIDQDKTVFVRFIASEAPAWNAVTKLFAENSDVAFMDVNLSEESIREGPNGEPYSPGMGGWPTIRFFNQETGIAGGAYTKRTSDPMCTELGNEDYMLDYVEQYAKTQLCNLDTGAGCTEKELNFFNKYKDKSAEEIQLQMKRLESTRDSKMAPHLLQWLKQKERILKRLSDEL